MSPIKDRIGSVKVGDLAPAFRLQSARGDWIGLEDLLALQKVIVLYFYPRDFTPGCTIEACGFRDSYEAFVEAGAVVVGVSGDSTESHQKFVEKHGLPFTLLSDPDGAVRHLYGSSPTLGLLPRRVTFVIDKQGTIRLIFVSQIQAGEHVEKALELVSSL